ncbi:hypothetical protein CEXT_814901 [Caerostris extrusa]|uniref:Uncharacterized protein n=1 Tax=Caerostris extrusa TaxID=172846 RepID=A0AAV4SEZ0_CAEEX|nr:hypothetical protein CEXT_814901 [Caerostris extrusa]
MSIGEVNTVTAPTGLCGASRNHQIELLKIRTHNSFRRKSCDGGRLNTSPNCRLLLLLTLFAGFHPQNVLRDLNAPPLAECIRHLINPSKAFWRSGGRYLSHKKTPDKLDFYIPLVNSVDKQLH